MKSVEKMTSPAQRLASFKSFLESQRDIAQRAMNDFVADFATDSVNTVEWHADSMARAVGIKSVAVGLLDLLSHGVTPSEVKASVSERVFRSNFLHTKSGNANRNLVSEGQLFFLLAVLNHLNS